MPRICVVCSDSIDCTTYLIPSRCIRQNGLTSTHTICYTCWFDPIGGFGLETSLHECPGCSIVPSIVPSIDGLTAETAIIID
jgi:hypothetical protein